MADPHRRPKTYLFVNPRPTWKDHRIVLIALFAIIAGVGLFFLQITELEMSIYLDALYLKDRARTGEVGPPYHYGAIIHAVALLVFAGGFVGVVANIIAYIRHRNSGPFNEYGP